MNISAFMETDAPCVYGRRAVLLTCMGSIRHVVYTGKLLVKTILLCLYFTFEYMQSQVTDKKKTTKIFMSVSSHCP